MVHFLQYQAYVAKDNDVAVLNLTKKWFEDWFNVFDLYNISNICYCNTIRIPYVNQNFDVDDIAQFYVGAIVVEEGLVQLQLLFYYSDNLWLNPYNQMLSQVIKQNEEDFLLKILVPIAEIKKDLNETYPLALDYICSTFTECINQNISIT